jgi:two-component system sensor histidine kinase UhpB
MSLRYQIIVRILLLSICILLLGGAIAIWQARQAVSKEVDSSVQLVLQLISLGLVDAPIVQQDALSGIAALRQTRHLSIEIKQADGRIVHLAGHQPASRPESMPPDWFIRAVQGDYPRVEHHLRTQTGQLLTLVIQAQPLDEISEIWEESLTFFASISLLALLTFVAVNVVLNKSLRSIADIVKALHNIEAGDYSRKLPPFSTLEFNRIAWAINHMTQELAKTREENRALTQHSLAIQEDERQHLAQELHDEFGQSLTAIKVMSVTAARRNVDITDISTAIVASCDHLMGLLRSMMQQLHPLILSELGLKATLEDMVNRWLERHPQLSLQIECGVEVDSLEPSISIQLFRVIQECLTNVLRHAEANTVVVQLQILDPDFAHADNLSRQPENPVGKVLLLNVKDDGHGCELTAVQHGFGLRGMQERIRSLGGELQIVSTPGTGMLVNAWVPLP